MGTMTAGTTVMRHTPTAPTRVGTWGQWGKERDFHMPVTQLSPPPSPHPPIYPPVLPTACHCLLGIRDNPHMALILQEFSVLWEREIADNLLLHTVKIAGFAVG